MTNPIETCPHLILELTSPYLLERGVYGRITNINVLKAIFLVCKKWQEWIYNSSDGPFSLIGNHIKEIQKQKDHSNEHLTPLKKMMQYCDWKIPQDALLGADPLN
jgi:hypothetical protein